MGGALIGMEDASIPKRDIINAFFCRVNGTLGMVLPEPVVMCPTLVINFLLGQWITLIAIMVIIVFRDCHKL